VTQNQSNKPTDADKEAKDIVRNVLEGMPSVSTRGDGPSGKKIEGFLYRYRKGEEVRIGRWRVVMGILRKSSV